MKARALLGLSVASLLYGLSVLEPAVRPADGQPSQVQPARHGPVRCEPSEKADKSFRARPDQAARVRLEDDLMPTKVLHTLDIPARAVPREMTFRYRVHHSDYLVIEIEAEGAPGYVFPAASQPTLTLDVSRCSVTGDVVLLHMGPNGIDTLRTSPVPGERRVTARIPSLSLFMLATP